MKNTTNTRFTILASLILILISAFCITGTVYSQSNQTNQKEISLYYKELETSYLSEMRSMLNGKGYKNSGITINHITEEDGERTYTVMIHHDKIEKLSLSEKESLIEECKMISFADDTSHFEFDFLE